MKKWLTRIIPIYAFLPLVLVIIFNALVYNGSMLLVNTNRMFDLSICLDALIPVVPASVFVYSFWFAFIAVNYVLIARLGKREVLELSVADMSGKFVCLLFFLLMPSTIARPEIVGTGVADYLLRFTYIMDKPLNLFPSIHCFSSWLCFIGLRSRPEIPRIYKVITCAMALAICASTVLTKQHVVVDIIGGIALAEAAYVLARHTPLPRLLGRVLKISL